MKRTDDFEKRRQHLKDLTEEQLEARFWELTEKIVDPLVTLADKHTTPSIERSVLLRMGFSSLEAKAIVDGAVDRGLLGKGVGHLVFRIARENNMEIREAGLELIEGKLWDQLVNLFVGGEK